MSSGDEGCDKAGRRFHRRNNSGQRETHSGQRRAPRHRYAEMTYRTNFCVSSFVQIPPFHSSACRSSQSLRLQINRVRASAQDTQRPITHKHGISLRARRWRDNALDTNDKGRYPPQSHRLPRTPGLRMRHREHTQVSTHPRSELAHYHRVAMRIFTATDKRAHGCIS